MKKLIIGVLAVLILVAVMTIPAIAAEEYEQAEVTVTEYINFTIGDYGADGIKFGSQSAGSANVSEVDQDTNHGAVDLIVGSETNVDCNLQVKGTGDFSDGATHTLSLDNAKWDTDNDVTGYHDMTTTYATAGTSTAGASANVSLWHWLSIPSDQYTGTYHTDFYYQAIAQP